MNTAVRGFRRSVFMDSGLRRDDGYSRKSLALSGVGP
jgi:hypothetical protein